MFAAAFWTESRHRLVLVRDRMGIKPLYFRRHAGNLYFGSELKAILLHPELDRRMSGVGLDHFPLAQLRTGDPHTGGGNRKIPPGRWMEWRGGAATERGLLETSVPSRASRRP